jgi:hypothetical protein
MKYADFKKLKKQMLEGPLSEKESKEEEAEDKAIDVAKQKVTKLKTAVKNAETLLKPVED